jgi:L-ribulose-5-phosphate 4-epimerase
MKTRELRQRAYEANMELPKRGLVLYTFGNASAIDRGLGFVAIKPSGVPYESLKWEEMVVVDMNGEVVDSHLAPSSDMRTHLVLYDNFAEIGGIAHTHSTHATAWAQARRPIPIFGTTHADHLNTDVPCTEIISDEAIAGDYEFETGNQILSVFSRLSYGEVEMVLVAGHGPFTWGKDAQKAVYNSVVLEELARMAFLTLQADPSAQRLKQTLVDRHFQRKHGKNAYYGQESSKAER